MSAPPASFDGVCHASEPVLPIRLHPLQRGSNAYARAQFPMSNAAAPVQQFMDLATGLEIVKENAILKHQMQQLQTSVDIAEQQKIQALGKLEKAKKLLIEAEEARSRTNCCENACVCCTQMFCQCTYRCNAMCTQKCVEPVNRDYISNGGYCSMISAWTVCLPCVMTKYFIWGTTYVCCDAGCSKMCLDIK